MQGVDRKSYWESIHEENSAGDVSWYQATPLVSLRLIEQAKVDRDARVIDVGCGQRGIAGSLVERGFTRVTALDISGEAIRRAKEGLGARADAVAWVQGDVLDLAAPEPFALWHDRALLHFFIEAADTGRYIESVRRNVGPGGHAIIATFAPDGPEKCSGLPVQRHDAGSVGRILGPDFALLATERDVHATPWGTHQAFQWTVFKRA